MKLFGRIMLLFLVSFMIASTISFAREKEIPLSEVPQAVIDAAKREIKGIRLIEAEIITKTSGETLYEIEGKVGGKKYELHITPGGKVIGTILED